jgi:pyruvate kinase
VEITHTRAVGARLLPDKGINLPLSNLRLSGLTQALPRLLLSALRTPPVGVMVARGDLAVEVGFERLAEVQEEILWLCEAAHVPAIWATQVLENLTKKGAPSRAEVTDAATAVRAECVMLNKGPYVIDAVAFLDDVLRRMQGHHDKKRAMLRRLSVAGGNRRGALWRGHAAEGQSVPIPMARGGAP